MSAFVARWRREVFRSPAIGDGTRVLLLHMADHMDARGYVSIPRAQLAAAIARNERRVAERLQEAVAARLLDTVQRGRPGTTAVYVALLGPAVTTPVKVARADRKWDREGAKGADVRMRRIAAPIRGADVRTTGHAQHGADGGRASSKHVVTSVARVAFWTPAGSSPRRGQRKFERVPTTARLQPLRGVA